VQSIISNIALMFTDCDHFNPEVIDLRAASEFFSGLQKHKRLSDGQSGVPPFLCRSRRERLNNNDYFAAICMIVLTFVQSSDK